MDLNPRMNNWSSLFKVYRKYILHNQDENKYINIMSKCRTKWDSRKNEYRLPIEKHWKWLSGYICPNLFVESTKRGILNTRNVALSKNCTSYGPWWWCPYVNMTTPIICYPSTLQGLKQHCEWSPENQYQYGYTNTYNTHSSMVEMYTSIYQRQ